MSLQLALWETPETTQPLDSTSSKEDRITSMIKLHLSAAVPLAIEQRRQRGVTETDWQWAQEKMQAIREAGGGHAIAFLDKGHTQQEMALLTEMLAVLAYITGGVAFAGLRFDAEHTMFGVVLDAAFFESIEPFRVAMEREEQHGSKHPDEVSAEDMRRVHELEVLMCKAADGGNEAEVARLEAEIDGVLLQLVVSEVA